MEEGHLKLCEDDDGDSLKFTLAQVQSKCNCRQRVIIFSPTSKDIVHSRRLFKLEMESLPVEAIFAGRVVENIARDGKRRV